MYKCPFFTSKRARKTLKKAFTHIYIVSTKSVITQKCHQIQEKHNILKDARGH